MRVSFRTDEGTGALRDRLSGLAGEALDTAASVPDGWRRVRDRLREDGRPQIAYEEYVTLCVDSGITDAAEQRAILGFLGDLGAVVAVHEGEETTIVTDLRWIVDAVYRLTTADVVRQGGGVLHPQALAALLPGPRYSRRGRKVILALMAARGYGIELDDGTFLLPSLLSAVQPEAPARRGRSIGYVAELEFLPHYLVAEILARVAADLADGQAWRSGMLLRSAIFRAEATLVADTEGRRVVIDVWGDEPRPYLALLRHRVAEAASALGPGIARELVPLPGGGGVDYHEVVALDAMGRRDLADPVRRQTHSIQYLLEGRNDMSPADIQPSPERTVWNIQAANVSFGSQSQNEYVASARADAVDALVAALQTSGLEGAEAHSAEIVEAHAASDAPRLRRATLAALDAGAKVSQIANAATAVLSNL